MSKPSILLAPWNFAMMPLTIARALKQRGYRCDHLWYRSRNDIPFGFGYDRLYDPREHGGRTGAQIAALTDILAEGFDIFHFWNRSLFFELHFGDFTGLDLLMIKARQRKIVWRFTGKDVRLPAQDLAWNPHSIYRYGYRHPFDVERQKRFHAFIAEYADALLVQDPELQMHWPGARIIPRALDLGQWPYVGPGEADPDGGPLVVHVPTDPLIKGTRFVRKALDELREEGLRFRVRIERGLDQEAFRRLMQSADIVVDQLHLGLGVTTLEAWATGKAVVCNLRPEVFGDLYGNDPPVAVANPDTVKATLRRLIGDRHWREDLAVRGRACVERHHDIDRVIEQFVELYHEVHAQPPAMPDGTGDVAYFAEHARDLAELRKPLWARLRRRLTATRDRLTGRLAIGR